MPRYEYTDDKSNKFWEIQLEGTDVTTQWGRMGTDGQSKTKSFDDTAAAQKEYDKMIASKTKKGYALVESEDGGEDGGSMSVSVEGLSNPGLEAVIFDNPEDPSGYLVYADWLQAQGDPLGEVISVQMKLSADPANAELRAAEKALFEANTESLLGPMAEGDEASELMYDEFSDYYRPNGWSEHGWHYGFARTQWKNGFIENLFYDSGYYDDEDERGSDVAVQPLVALLGRPSARFVREIAFGDLWANYDEGEGPEMEYAIRAIVNAPCAKTLRRIEFTGGEHDISGVSLDDEGLAEACPNLETLVLCAGDLGVGVRSYPKVKRYAVQSGGLSSGSAKAVAASDLPECEDLELWFGSENYGGDCSVDDIEPIFLGTKLPKLKRLALMNSEFGDDICRAVVNAAVLPRLTHIDLSMGIITDEGGQALLDAKDRLGHLDQIVIAGYFSEAMAESLRGLGPDVALEVRGPPDDEYRYVQVGE